MECDLGQTEFTPPGLVSLNYVSLPILGINEIVSTQHPGPPFTHLRQPHKSFYIGATTPKHDPDFYLACITQLYNDYLATSSKDVPLVINTQGWIKGLLIFKLLNEQAWDTICCPFSYKM